MQHERHGLQPLEGRFDGVEVFRALGQDQNLAALREGDAHLGGDGLGPELIVGEMSENVLYSGILRQIDASVAGSRHDLQIVRRSGRSGRRVADRPALHEDDRLLPVASDRGPFIAPLMSVMVTSWLQRPHQTLDSSRWRTCAGIDSQRWRAGLVRIPRHRGQRSALMADSFPP
jgi:hypothetical protein